MMNLSFGRALTVAILGGLLLSMLTTHGITPPGEDGGTRILHEFMAPNARISQFLAVSSHPELLKKRRVQMKVFRSLGSKDIGTFQAALALCIEAPDLRSIPMIYRRFETSFLSPKVERRKAILDLATSHPEFLEQLTVVGLIAATLRDQDSTLSEMALSLVQKESLRKNPAIAEALGQSNMKLPNYEAFKSKVEPILRTSGEDDKACLNCHQHQAAFRLPVEETAAGREEAVKSHYRSALLMIDLVQPEKSMILRKPTNPSPTKTNAPPSLETHGGGTRFEKDSAPYKAILGWIQTGKP